MFANERVAKSRPGKKLRAAIYSRPSASDQSHKDREPELVTYCSGREWEPVLFRDERSMVAGARAGLELLLDTVRSRDVKAVVCANMTDLAGSLAQFAALCRELKTHRVGLVCIDQGIDTVSEPGKAPNPAAGLFYGFLAVFLEFDRRRASEGTRNGLKAARARGSRLGRRPKVTASQRRLILRLRHEGLSLRAIGREVALAPSTVWLSLHTQLAGERRAA